MDRKFERIFGNRFHGHKQILNRKLGKVQQDLLHIQGNRVGVRYADLTAVTDYVDRVSQNVTDAFR